MSGSRVAVLAALLGALPLLVVVGSLRMSSRYQATEPEEQARQAPRVVAAGTYQELPLHAWVARAHHDAVAAAACPLTYLPVSPDPRRKES